MPNPMTCEKRGRVMFRQGERVYSLCRETGYCEAQIVGGFSLLCSAERPKYEVLL